MFWIILRRELQEGLTSFTFLSTMAVVSVLVPLSAYTQARYYRQTISDYALRQAIHQAEARSGMAVVTRPVPPLLPIFNGLYARLPDEILLLRASVSRTPTSEDLRPLDWLFPKVDLGLIIGVLMTLTAILLSHDVITGEREQGTLGLMLSGSVARRTVLGAKATGVILLVMLGVAYAVLLYLLLLASLNGGTFEFTISRLFELSIVGLLSVLTVIVFALLGLTISTLVRYSATALAISVTIWTVSVLIWPSLAPYLASSLWPVSPRQVAQRQFLTKEAEVIRGELSEHRKAAAELKAQNADVEIAWQRYLEIKRRWNEQKRAELHSLAAERQRRIWRQQTGALRLLLVSPYGVFKAALGTICDTGLEGYHSFLDSAERYDLEEFTPASFEALAQEKPWIKATGNAERLQPRPFLVTHLSLQERLKRVAWPVSLLIVEIGFLVIACLFRFDRYDVR